MRTFIALSSKEIVEKIKKTNHIVVYAAPGLSKEIAEALVLASQKPVNVEVIVDASPVICRLGYGTVEGFNLLNDHKIPLRNCPRLRIGMLISDSEAWVFSPTPLSLEDESKNDMSPNAIVISDDEAQNILAALAIESPLDDRTHMDKKIDPEIGQNIVSDRQIELINKDVKENPPQKFDLSRKVRVFNSLLEYVEVRLIHCDIQKHTISLPSELLGLAKDDDMRDRIRSTVRLIGNESGLSGKHLSDKKEELMKKYTRQLGEPFGNVILRSHKEDFCKEIEALRADIKKQQQNIRDNLENELLDTVHRIAQILAPAIIENPPNDLIAQIQQKKPSREQAERYLIRKIYRIIPPIDKIFEKMELKVHFKGITYETLTDPRFEEVVEKAYSLIDWESIFQEYEAVPTSDKP